MKLEPKAGQLTTGDVSLSSCLNAMGIPPAPFDKFAPVKGYDGHDFVRIAVCSQSIDGNHRTVDLMKRWREGARSVRAFPSCPFSALQVWSKTRASIQAAQQRGVVCWIGNVGPWRCIVTDRDREEWLDPGTAIELRDTPAMDVCPQESELAAALVVLGVPPIGFGPGGWLAFPTSGIKATIGAAEMLECWPDMVPNHDSPAAYFAAAADARRMSYAAIKAQDPVILIMKGSELATFRQSEYEAGDKNATAIAKKIRV